jgi:hypothetical protein
MHAPPNFDFVRADYAILSAAQDRGLTVSGNCGKQRDRDRHGFAGSRQRHLHGAVNNIAVPSLRAGAECSRCL